MATAVKPTRKRNTKVFIYTSDHLDPGSSTFEFLYADIIKIPGIKLIIKREERQILDDKVVLNLKKDLLENPNSVFILLLGDYNLFTENFDKCDVVNRLIEIYRFTDSFRFDGVLIVNTILPYYKFREYTAICVRLNEEIWVEARPYNKVECTDIWKQIRKCAGFDPRLIFSQGTRLSQRGGEVIAKILYTEIQAGLSIIWVNFRGNNFTIFKKKYTFWIALDERRGPFDGVTRSYKAWKREWGPWKGCTYLHRKDGAHYHPETNEVLFHGCYIKPPTSEEHQERVRKFTRPYMEFKQVRYDPEKEWGYGSKGVQYLLNKRFYEVV